MIHDINTIWNCIPDGLSLDEEIVYGWILYQVNDEQGLKISECSSMKIEMINRLVQNEQLEIQDDKVIFSKKFEKFLVSLKR